MKFLAMWIALFPLTKPTTEATAYFGGMERDGDEHVHVVRHKMPLDHPTLLLPGQFPKNFTHMHAELAI